MEGPSASVTKDASPSARATSKPEPEGATVEGTIERIVFANEESGWTVLRLTVAGRREPVTVVGNLIGIQVGENLRVTGEWTRDPRFGEQLAAKSFLTVTPSTRIGIERYLASGLVPGIGPAMAKRLVERFGVETLDVIERSGERLKEVEGIGPVRAARICEAWAEQREIKDVMIFLQSHGISTAFAIRIFKRYGRGAVRAVKENPYRLAQDVSGIGFLSADRIARSLGIRPDAPERAEAGVVHALDELTDTGHVYAPRPLLIERASRLLERPEGETEAALEALLERGALRLDPTAAEGAPAIYTRALFEAEVRSASRLAELQHAPKRAIRIDVEKAVAWFETECGLTLAEEQKAALVSVIQGKVTVITGGPGTGKTTIVNGVIRILEKKGARIALAAPTGRAAKRLFETTGREAKTLHRLLEYDPKGGGFTRNEENPLELDVLVVDETSMVDLALFDTLLAAVPKHAQLILVGDVDQLPSVGPGSVLSDVIASESVGVARLQKIFRQAESSLIITNAHRINRGEMPRVERDASGDFFHIERNEPEEILATIKELIHRRIPTRFGVDPVEDIQVLTPMHKGSLGSANLNQELQALLNPRGDALVRGQRILRAQDKVMQLRNNYDLGVFNGDIGRVVSVDVEAKSALVRFDERDVPYETGALDELTLAYACSIHKSQGSEFPVVIIPLSTQHYVMLAKNLIYTAVTRGRRLVVLVGSTRALAMAIENAASERRYSNLAARLKHACDTGV